MVRIIGYGEDGLTYCALEDHLDEFLEKVNDQPNPDNCLVFYRPSLGRGSKLNKTFGEFDAIVVSKSRVYLIESKWEKSDEWKKRKNTITISDSQIRRHEIFAWYLTRWRIEDTWESFENEYEEEFRRKFNGRNMPASNRTLAINLKQILPMIIRQGPANLEPVNVILFFRRKDSPVKEDPSCDSKQLHFDVVVMKFDPIGDSNLFEMNP